MAGMRAWRVAAALMAALVALCAFSAVAFAASVSVWGAQTYLSEDSTKNDTSLNLVFLSGTAGDEASLTVADGSKTLTRYLPHALGESAAEGESVTDVFSINIAGGLDESKLRDGSYTVEAWTKRGGDKLYAGTVYGVWAKLGEAENTQLIGARTASDGEAFQFVPPSVIHANDTAYQLVSSTPTMDGQIATYEYTAFEPTETVDGQVTYVDKDGSILKTETFPVSTDGAAATHAIPATIDVDGKRYRTIAFAGEVTATYPTQTAFTVPCEYMGGAAYLANIQMVDEDGNVIASDSVNVDGKYTYTAPTTIYKQEEVAGEQRAVTYALDDDEVWPLDASADAQLVVNGERTVTIHYQRQNPDTGEIAVTYYQVDGQDNPELAGRVLGSQTKTVTKDNPNATPDDRVTVDGATYVLASAASDYAYAYGSGDTPVIDAYYVPEGYKPAAPYTVTVRYVNYANNEVVRTQTFESTNDPAVVSVTGPASFSESGVDYVRLAGQNGISHNFYSGMDTYTVYYRDSNDTLSEGVVVERTRVVVREVTNTVTRQGTQRPAARPAGTTGNQGAATNQGAGASLNPTAGYNAIGGTANGTLVNDRGQDANTERIGDDTTPLASSTEGSESTSASSSVSTPAPPAEQGGLPAGAIAGILVALAAAAGIIWWFITSRRREDEDGYEA